MTNALNMSPAASMVLTFTTSLTISKSAKKFRTTLPPSILSSSQKTLISSLKEPEATLISRRDNETKSNNQVANKIATIPPQSIAKTTIFSSSSMSNEEPLSILRLATTSDSLATTEIRSTNFPTTTTEIRSTKIPTTPAGSLTSKKGKILPCCRVLEIEANGSATKYQHLSLGIYKFYSYLNDRYSQ